MIYIDVESSELHSHWYQHTNRINSLKVINMNNIF